MALNTDANFPPAGNPPYAINREWCIGDSLGYINLNSQNFDNRLTQLQPLSTALLSSIAQASLVSDHTLTNQVSSIVISYSGSTLKIPLLSA